jgi:Lysyl oxidase
VTLDPGIWLASLGSAVEFRVQRASYTKPITITQIIHLPSGTRVRRLPASVLDGWNGLGHFLRFRMTGSGGKAVASGSLTFCPNSPNPQRAGSGGPLNSRYPQFCSAFGDPFQLATVWGLAKDWAVDPFFYDSFTHGPYRIRPGHYTLTAAVTPRYRKLFRVVPSGASATVHVTVVKGPGPAGGGAWRAGPQPRTAGRPVPPPMPTLANPPRAARPHLIALPAWSITTSNVPGHDLVSFAATVWVRNAPLDVEGFRSHGSPVMKAYQYFWRNGHVIGRARAGTMGFESGPGENHWHFEQFARYTLLNAARSVTVRSHKEGFCIGPSDPVDLLLPHATWQPSSIGLQGQCGSPTALWVAERLPLGWGDTYLQSSEGQSFDITHVPNGTYYVEVTANPERVLYETSTRNDVSLRKVILGGTPGQRTVKVPAWHGIDPEP